MWDSKTEILDIRLLCICVRVYLNSIGDLIDNEDDGAYSYWPVHINFENSMLKNRKVELILLFVNFFVRMLLN